MGTRKKETNKKESREVQESHSFTATEAKNKFGELLEFARRDPVKIHKNGRPVAVMLSAEEYERLELLEDEWWAKKAIEASRDGFLNAEDSEEFLAEMMNVKD